MALVLLVAARRDDFWLVVWIRLRGLMGFVWNDLVKSEAVVFQLLRLRFSFFSLQFFLFHFFFKFHFIIFIKVLRIFLHFVVMRFLVRKIAGKVVNVVWLSLSLFVGLRSVAMLTDFMDLSIGLLVCMSFLDFDVFPVIIFMVFGGVLELMDFLNRALFFFLILFQAFFLLHFLTLFLFLISSTKGCGDRLKVFQTAVLPGIFSDLARNRLYQALHNTGCFVFKALLLIYNFVFHISFYFFLHYLFHLRLHTISCLTFHLIFTFEVVCWVLFVALSVFVSECLGEALVVTEDIIFWLLRNWARVFSNLSRLLFFLGLCGIFNGLNCFDYFHGFHYFVWMLVFSCFWEFFDNFSDFHDVLAILHRLLSVWDGLRMVCVGVCKTRGDELVGGNDVVFVTLLFMLILGGVFSLFMILMMLVVIIWFSHFVFRLVFFVLF